MMILTTLLTLLIFGIFFYLMMQKGGCCGSHGHHGGHEGHADSGDHTNTGHTPHHMETVSSSEGTETDPVCGMKVNDDKIESTHQSKTFHFCSEQCKKLFNLNPNKYTGA